MLVTAVGVKPGLITGEMLKEGSIVIDVATIRVKDPETGKTSTFGDVDFESAKDKVGHDHAGARRRRRGDDGVAVAEHGNGREVAAVGSA